MTDKEKVIKELKEVLDNLDITNKYRLNLIDAIEYLQEESAYCIGIGEPKKESGVLGEMIKEIKEEPKDHCKEPVSEDSQPLNYKGSIDNLDNAIAEEGNVYNIGDEYFAFLKGKWRKNEEYYLPFTNWRGAYFNVED